MEVKHILGKDKVPLEGQKKAAEKLINYVEDLDELPARLMELPDKTVGLKNQPRAYQYFGMLASVDKLSEGKLYDIMLLLRYG